MAVIDRLSGATVQPLPAPAVGADAGVAAPQLGGADNDPTREARPIPAETVEPAPPAARPADSSPAAGADASVIPGAAPWPPWETSAAPLPSRLRARNPSVATPAMPSRFPPASSTPVEAMVFHNWALMFRPDPSSVPHVPSKSPSKNFVQSQSGDDGDVPCAGDAMFCKALGNWECALSAAELATARACRPSPSRLVASGATANGASCAAAAELAA